MAGRILWLLLSMREAEGRSTFLNRELRIHPFLKLPSLRDNLENRLLSLERRMEKRSLPIRLDRAERGRMRLSCDACPRLEKVAA